ncbi:MAG: hypothetical protein AB1499_07790 [Nitrospirota bacterium]
MENKIKTCPVCEKPLDKCECCAECGHICSLDLGEPHCPVCFPEKQPDKPNDA